MKKEDIVLLLVFVIGLVIAIYGFTGYMLDQIGTVPANEKAYLRDGIIGIIIIAISISIKIILSKKK